jgi:CTP synthase (UTP-ammonia lyase)
MMTKTIALVGDFNEQILAHVAILKTIELAKKNLGARINWQWLETDKISDDGVQIFSEFSAFWVVPGSPYKNMEGVLNVIRFARENRLPFLGTCGGFQHALIEYARNVCGVADADHAETNADAKNLIVVPLECSLIEKTSEIIFIPESQLYLIFKGKPTTEGFHCQYGLSPLWKIRLESAGLRFTGHDLNGEVRTFELPNHPFFIGTLFQPERAALNQQLHPIISAFLTQL